MKIQFVCLNQIDLLLNIISNRMPLCSLRDCVSSTPAAMARFNMLHDSMIYYSQRPGNVEIDTAGRLRSVKCHFKICLGELEWVENDK